MVAKEPREVVEIHPVFADREANRATATDSHTAPADTVRRADDEDRVQMVAYDKHRAGLCGKANAGGTLQNFIGREYAGPCFNSRPFVSVVATDLEDSPSARTRFRSRRRPGIRQMVQPSLLSLTLTPGLAAITGR